MDWTALATGISGGLGFVSDLIANETNKQTAEANLQYQKEYDEKVMQREDTALQRQTKDATNAGINPLVAIGKTGAESSGAGMSAPQSNYQAMSPNLNLDSMADAMNKTQVLEQEKKAQADQVRLEEEKIQNERNVQEENARHNKETELLQERAQLEVERNNKKGNEQEEERIQNEVNRINKELDQLRLEREKFNEDKRQFDEEQKLKEKETNASVEKTESEIESRKIHDAIDTAIGCIQMQKDQLYYIGSADKRNDIKNGAERETQELQNENTPEWTYNEGNWTFLSEKYFSELQRKADRGELQAGDTEMLNEYYKTVEELVSKSTLNNDEVYIKNRYIAQANRIAKYIGKPRMEYQNYWWRTEENYFKEHEKARRYTRY